MTYMYRQTGTRVLKLSIFHIHVLCQHKNKMTFAKGMDIKSEEEHLFLMITIKKIYICLCVYIGSYMPSLGLVNDKQHQVIHVRVC